MSRWQPFDYPIPFSRKPAIYAIYLDGKLAYIGQTSDLQSRMADHKIKPGYAKNFYTKWGVFSEVKFKVSFSRKYGDWAMRELRLIRRLRPWANLRSLGRKRAA